jgi:spore maturation protein CgeB
MSYKFQKFTTVYPGYTEQFLVDNPDYRSLSYQQLYERFVGSHYGWADYYARKLGALGREAQDIIADVEPLQKAWARERGVNYRPGHWLRDIALAQVRCFRPDVIFLQDLYTFDASFRRQLRQAGGKGLLMIGWQAAPIKDYSLLRDLDLVLTCAPHFVDYIRQAGMDAALFLHAFEPSVLASLPSNLNRDLDFTFIGSFVIQQGFHNDRYALVRYLMQSTPLHVWGQVHKASVPSRRIRLMSKAAAVAGKLTGRGSQRTRPQTNQQPGPRVVPEGVSAGNSAGPNHQNRFHDPVFGLRYYEILARSKLTFNSHIDCAEQYAGNMRLFEATGAGACLLTDRKSNLSELFEPDVELVTYGSAEECAEKVNYLLEHDELRVAIAAAGQRRVLRDHTFEQRAIYLDELIQQALR